MSNIHYTINKKQPGFSSFFSRTIPRKNFCTLPEKTAKPTYHAVYDHSGNSSSELSLSYLFLRHNGHKRKILEIILIMDIMDINGHTFPQAQYVHYAILAIMTSLGPFWPLSQIWDLFPLWQKMGNIFITPTMAIIAIIGIMTIFTIMFIMAILAIMGIMASMLNMATIGIICIMRIMISRVIMAMTAIISIMDIFAIIIIIIGIMGICAIMSIMGISASKLVKGEHISQLL